jgi:nitroreductase
MNLFQILEKRKSIRQFIPGKKIPDGDIKKILKVINLAPSAGNLQSYKVFAIKNKDKRIGFAKFCNRQNPEFIPSSSLILVFCTNPKNAKERFGVRGENLYSVQDATIAASFAVLAATALGYGSCWVGSFQEEPVKKILRTKLLPVAALIIGFGNEDPERKARKPQEEMVEYI